MGRTLRILLLTVVVGVLGAATAAPQRTPTKDIAFQLEEASPEMRREVAALVYLLRRWEIDELLLQRTDYMLRRWIDEYWKRMDPNFTTEASEMQIEHARRVAHAMDKIFVPDWPGWDQRGEVHIRYGPPAFRKETPAGTLGRTTTPPGEIWYYRQHDMYVLFQDPFWKGNFTYYLENVKVAGTASMDRVSAPIDAALMPDLPRPVVGEGDERAQFRKMVGKFEEVREETPASYPFNFDRNRMPFFFAVDNFRGGEWINRVDVNVEFFANFSARHRKQKTRRYVATAVFWDIDHEEVGRRSQVLDLPVVQGTVDSTRIMPSQLVFSLAPGFYHMAVTVQEEPSGRFTSYKTDVTCEDLETKLALSDLCFASKIAPTSGQSPFNRGALQVVPHPIRRYPMSGSVPVYFEVYNLAQDTRGMSLYTVEYRITSKTPRAVSFWESLRGKKPTLDVSSGFQGSNYGSENPVQIAIGTDNLWPGEWGLQVTITDEISQASAIREAAFNIVE